MNMALKALLTTGLLVATSAGALCASESQEKSKATTLDTSKSYQIRNKKFGNLLRPQNANRRDGTPVVLYPIQAWKCLTWRVTPSQNEAYFLQNHYTSKTFASKSGKGDNANRVVQVPYDVKSGKRPDWKFIEVENNFYQIVDPISGRVLTAVKPNGEHEAHVILDVWDNREEQLWELLDAPKRLEL